MAKATLKTTQTDADPAAFVAAIADPRRRADCTILLDLMSRITGEPARMWGPSMVGFGRYHYRYESGREGDSFRTGFAPRKADLTIYIMPGYGDFGPILERLGKHRLGKSCLYLKALSDVDLAVLEELIRAGLKRMDALYPRQG